ncbi:MULTISPECIES: crotonase/enoyl-CoA hydratase family protein [Cryobacterium]|uniref:Crotonase/enoyl-CoA hydratase family protein n=1 Tax=Cryobacterium levicorallinum TaxID=995038 RepID=A0A1I3CG13_9MICO|nr:MULTISPECIES: crotonase/enoyl-CoA hydratase family protein [Cryobacterium]TFB88812.1 crotonase/enoyl-CoA hydratase family protein [Cryobacterium levicorallinum]TFD55999.1 crotonase/enoyl-CoA hydratase family protein [Cryobacterium sp. Hh38]GEP27720.1 enoyl-CoA hydratase [Cryobacterium levicorallinum]SFH73442.1 Enoyl-CoA hydratase/carnithine racemase [Cryobacterium levicorallinum]
MNDQPRILTERRGHILLIGFNRPEKRNAADFALLRQLALAYGELDGDPELRVGLVYAVGEHFTAGLDLADIGPRLGPAGLEMVPEGGINPWQVDGESLSKPVVIAVQGTCLTLGIELMLASDIVVAAESTKFGQIEVARGILPFGGATIRFPRAAGWGNAMRWLLTGELFDTAEAHRLGLVQEVVPDGTQFDRALELAEKIAAQAPLAIQATLANARLAQREGAASAEQELQPALARLVQTEDSRIGMQSFMTRTPAVFVGR